MKKHDSQSENDAFIEAMDDLRRGIDIAIRLHGNKIEMKMDNVFASLPIDSKAASSGFRCNCGHSGDSLCKHYFILASAAVEMSNQLVEQYHNPTSAAERSCLRSKLVPKEMKTRLSRFRKDYARAYKTWRESNLDAHDSSLVALYDLRNKALDFISHATGQMLKDGKIREAFDTINYAMFYILRTVGYDSELEVMRDVVFWDTWKIWSKICRIGKKDGTEMVFKKLTKMICDDNLDDLPEYDIMENISDFLTEKFPQKKYRGELIKLSDRMIAVSEAENNEHILSLWVNNKIWMMSQMKVDGNVLYDECMKWWRFYFVRLTYLDYCMGMHNYKEASILAKECLALATNDEELEQAHRVLAGAYYKLDLPEKAAKESEWLAENAPDILQLDLGSYFMADEKRWDKSKKTLLPLLERARVNLLSR